MDEVMYFPRHSIFPDMPHLQPYPQRLLFPSTSLPGWCFLTSTVVDQGQAGCIISHLLLTSLIRCLSTHTWSVLRGRALQCLSDLSFLCM